MAIKGLIFDFDGTILDTEYPEFLVWQEIFKSYNTDLHLKEWAKTLGTTYKEFDPIHHLEQRTGRSIDAEEIFNHRNDKVLQIILQQPLLPGVMSYLTEAQNKGLSLGIASSSGRQWVQGHLERLGLTSFFDAIVTANDVRYVKPEPDLFLLVLNKMGLRPNEAIVLEDSPNGIKAAHQAGLRCVAIPNEISRHLDLSQADMIINSLEEIPLERLISKFSFQAKDLN
ncbi:MAG: HAD family hydrolase [Anaerolineae bacterium]|nr:HAD family hydrolase [Anaerolineae bacterium]